MRFVSRRVLLSGLGALTALAALPPPASAALARGLSLEELLRASVRAVVAMPLAAECRWAEFGGQRAIVTDTRVRVDEVLAKAEPRESELLVRTLGGSIGDLGERVDGQALLRRGHACVLFLFAAGESEPEFVTGMAQGHYSLRADARGVGRLWPSHNLPWLLRPERSAVPRLSGLDLPAARSAIRAALP